MKQHNVRHKYKSDLSGIAKTRLYIIWSHMKQRCYNENDLNYKKYGAKGITVCNEWLDNFMEFRNWAISNGYKEELTLDRIDSSKEYSPKNCRWATYKQQGNNRKNNHLLTYNGETHTISEWSEIVGISDKVIRERINRYRWTAEKALTTQVRPFRRKVFA